MSITMTMDDSELAHLKRGAVYLITCLPTGLVYVGQSYGVKQRIYTHKSDLKCGRHPVQAMQEAWDKHGEGAFTFEVVEDGIDPLFVTVREQFWIWRHEGRLFNKTSSAKPVRDRVAALRMFTDEELIAELKRRNTAVTVTK